MSGKENMMSDGLKFNIGDKIICVKTPKGNANPNLKKGDIAEVVASKKGMLAILAFKTKKDKYYCYWKEDDDCYKLTGGNLKGAIERECMVLGGK